MNNSIELFVEHFSLYTKIVSTQPTLRSTNYKNLKQQTTHIYDKRNINDWHKILRLGIPVIRNHISILNIDTI